VQEVLDLQLLAYAVAEHDEVLLPVMVCLDGFFLSHSMQKVDVPDIEAARAYLGPYTAKNSFLSSADPMFVCDLTGPEDFTEMRYQHQEGFRAALRVIPEMMKKFESAFGRKLSMVEEYQTADADAVLIALGSMCGTAKQVVNDMRARGKKVGLLKLTVFRPFPGELIKEALEGRPAIGVFDRSAGLGSGGGPLWNEVRSVMQKSQTEIVSFIGGLGGRDVPPATIEKAFNQLLAVAGGGNPDSESWIDVKAKPMEIREVLLNV
jgi:pyruvate ferredoxin oxidoreductase alpha subunit